MEVRTPKNTQALQEGFGPKYEKFFAKNDLVVSGNYSFSWGAMGIGHRSQHGRIKSKLPLKMYIGINKNSSGKVVIKDVSFYDFASNQFKKETFSQIHKQEKEILSIIEDFLREKKLAVGIDISILGEAPRGIGLGFSGLLGAIISVGLHIFSKDLDPELLNNNQQFQSTEVFQKVASLGQKVDFVARHKNLGINSKFALIQADFPYIFFSERFGFDININEIEKIQYEYFSLEKILLGENYLKEAPFDLAIVFTGQAQKTDVIEHSMLHDRKKYNVISEFIEHDVLAGCNFSKKTNFYKFIEKESIYEHLSDTASVMGLKVLFLLKMIYLQGYDTNISNDFIDQINVLRNVLSLTEKQEDFAQDFIYSFKNSQSNKSEKAGIKPIYSGKNGGGYLVIMKDGISRKTFEHTVASLQQKYPSMSLVYASWLDGSASHGPQVQQFISKGLFSKYINKNQVFLRTTHGENHLCDYNEIINTHKEGLLLDAVKNKVYFNGKKLTSKDICSQAATVGILDKLLDNMGRDVPNKEFELSSYSKNKNEMLGKIVIPLISYIEKESGMTLPLICKGAIYDFYLKLNKSDLKISVIKKI